MTETPEYKVGQRWDRRIKPTLHFPRNVRILEVLPSGVHLRNKDETYWVTRRMFDEVVRTGVLVLHEEGETDGRGAAEG